MGELGRAHGQVLKKSTLKIGQAGSKNQDLKQTPVHEEEGRIARQIVTALRFYLDWFLPSASSQYLTTA